VLEVFCDQTVKRFLPFRLRFANTRLPPTVELRLRKPCTRFLLMLLGWKVLFIDLS